MNAVSNDEDLTQQAREFVRENAFKKGAPNMTSRSFCTWVNDELLPNSTLDPGVPHKIICGSCTTMAAFNGFPGEEDYKGDYVDGHERADVVQARKEFLEKMTVLGFLHKDNAPSQEAARLLLNVDVDSNYQNTIFWFHDESSFKVNDDQPVMWKDDTMQVMRPKGRGAGHMVSDFIEERDGFLSLSNEIYSALTEVDSSILKSARVIFEFGKNREGTTSCLWNRWKTQ